MTVKLGTLILMVVLGAPAWAVELPFGVQWTDRDSRTWSSGHYVSIDPAYKVTSANTDGSKNCVVRKFSTAGFAIWETVFDDSCWGVISDLSGNTLVQTGGQRLSNPPVPGARVHKLGSGGATVWTIDFPTARFPNPYNRYVSRPVVADSLGNVVVPLETGGITEIVKLDSADGSTIWSYTIESGTIREMINHTGNRLYLLVEDGGNYFIQALDKDGNHLWTESTLAEPHGLIGGPDKVCYSVRQPFNSDFTATIVCRESGDGALYWLRALNSVREDWWPWDYKAFGGDGSLYIAWTVSDWGGTSKTRVFIWKLDPTDLTAIWEEEYDNPPVGQYAARDEVWALAVDAMGRTVMTVRSLHGTGAVVFNAAGTKIWDDFVADDEQSWSGIHAATDALGYTAIVEIDDQEVDLKRYGVPRDLWEYDRVFLWAHPWIHPGGPPQYHNFYDDVVDWISFHARAGQTYRITATTSGASLPGVQIQLYSGDAQALLQTALPDGGFTAATETSMVWSAPVSGSYQVKLVPTDNLWGAEREYDVTIAGDQGPSHLWSSKNGIPFVQDASHDVLEAPDGTSWVVGESWPAPGVSDLALYSLAEDGQLLAKRQYDGGGNEVGRAVTLSGAGNPVVVAETDSFSSTDDILLMELDGGSGTPQLVKRYDMDGYETVHDVLRDPDGGYFILGTTDVFGPRSIVILRVDEYGDLLWSRTFATPNGGDSIGHAMVRGEALTIAGQVGLFGLLMRVGLDGDFQWARTYGNNEIPVILRSLVETGMGFTATGAYPTIPNRGWLLATDPVGEPIWSRGYDDVDGWRIVESVDEGYIVAGTSTHDGGTSGMMIGVDGHGDVLWEHAYGDQTVQWLAAMSRSDDGGVVAVGRTRTAAAGPTFDSWAFKTDRLGRVEAGCTTLTPTSTIVSDITPTMFQWTPIALEHEPVINADDPLTWGTLTSSTQAQECVLHEPATPVALLLFTDGDTLSWGEGPGNDTYSLYRGGNVADTESFACLATDIVLPAHVDPDVPAAGELQAYLVVHDNALGEGPIGTDSAGDLRRHPADCGP